MLCDTTVNRSLIETKNTNAFSAWLRVIWTTRKNKNNNNTALILCEFTYAHFPGKIYLLALFSFGFDFVTDTHNTSNVINISFGYKQFLTNSLLWLFDLRNHDLVVQYRKFLSKIIQNAIRTKNASRKLHR